MISILIPRNFRGILAELFLFHEIPRILVEWKTGENYPEPRKL